jgi:3-(3-hydroxy-phenyl)propionate hydroxylase
MTERDCEVLVVGCGPTGVVLANLLGALGVRTVVLERDAQVFPVCRATHIDEETLRNFQATGLFSALLPHTAPFGQVDVVDADGAVLLSDAVRERDNVHGRDGSRFFDQPAFERVLRQGLARYPHVALHLGVTVDAVQVRDDGATVTATHATGPRTWRASWVVGCDGGRSTVRAAMNVSMRALAPKRHWLIVDTLLRDPADAARLPGNFRYVLDDERLTIYAHGFGLNRRWEFQLDEGEAPPDDETLRGWLRRFIDPARLELLRAVPYAQQSLIAERWRVGRALLAGDAAHMMPPSAGQGMCSGIRDALNLAWKLARVVSGLADPALLDSYEHERSWHVREILAGTLFIGNRLEARTAMQRWRRRNEFRMLAQLPDALREFVRQHAIRHPMITSGCFDEGAPLRGHHIPRATLHGDQDLDGALGYRFGLIVRDDLALPGGLPGDVTLLRVHADLDGGLRGWMDERRLDFVLVRPDRLLFSAGPLGDLPRALSALRRLLCPVALAA